MSEPASAGNRRDRRSGRMRARRRHGHAQGNIRDHATLSTQKFEPRRESATLPATISPSLTASALLRSGRARDGTAVEIREIGRACGYHGNTMTSPFVGKEASMLDLRPGCECCNADLPPESSAARICSFECTFCARCADGVLGGRCPNCGGELVPRPRRPALELARHPASTVRVYKPLGCGHVA